MTERDHKSVSLVLGSGGARGAAHIGVIRWLQENGYDIRSVSGCSIGALVGGVFAAGKLDEFEKWMCAITEREIFRLLDISWQISGLVKGDRIIDTLKNLVGERQIEELAITFTAVATSLDNEKEVWLQEGPLFDAIRASISLPLLLTPERRGGKTLIDGGVLNPVPIAPTFGDGTDLCIAVNLGGSSSGHRRDDKVRRRSKQDENGLRAKINAFIDNLGIGSGRDDDSSKDWGPFEIATQAFDIMQATISRQKLAVYPPDVLIEIPRNTCSAMEFQHAEKLIKLGYEQAHKALGRRSTD